MKKFLSVVAFSLLTIGFFTWYSNFGIPEIIPAPPPKEVKLDLGSMTMEQFIALGEKLFTGKGTCALCHNPVGGRAPLLDNFGDVLKKRLAEKSYAGKAKDIESYLYESMVEPSAYVVAGFGKKGSNNKISPMPDVSKGSIGLNDAEIKSVIAYLQNLNGIEVTVKVPKGAKAKPPVAAQASEGPREPFKTVEELFEEFQCRVCHKVAGEGGDVGPDLTHVGSKRDKDFLRRSILDPNAEITKGYEPDNMPPEIGEQLYAKELEIVVNYLAGLK
ncbi:MAG: c-type cytochrome [Methyloligellaceae bacterium]